MNRQISFRQYRTIDLSILLIILAACQTAIHFACSFWFPEELYVVSPIAAVVALVMMRWGIWAGIHAVLGGILFTTLSGGTWEHFVIYGAGNAVSLLALVFFKIFGKEKIRGDALLAIFFGLCTQLLMQLGRAGLAALLGYSAAACLGFVTTDSLSCLLTMVILWIIRRIDGLFEDQKHYLLRIQNDQSIEGREQF